MKSFARSDSFFQKFTLAENNHLHIFNLRPVKKPIVNLRRVVLLSDPELRKTI